MPTEQAINQFVAQPINNLLVFQSIVSLVIVVFGIYVIWKVAPALINLYKQQEDTNRQNAETNAKLTQIIGQNAAQARLATESVDKNTAEMVKQTSAIEAQTSVIEGQGLDLRNYQILVSDNLHSHTAQIEANTASVQAHTVLVQQMVEVGSKPVQTIAGKVTEIERMVNEILTNIIPLAEFKELLETDRQKYEDMFQAVRVDVEFVKRSLELCIEDKRKGDTGDMKAIAVAVAEPML